MTRSNSSKDEQSKGNKRPDGPSNTKACQASSNLITREEECYLKTALALVVVKRRASSKKQEQRYGKVAPDYQHDEVNIVSKRLKSTVESTFSCQNDVEDPAWGLPQAHAKCHYKSLLPEATGDSEHVRSMLAIAKCTAMTLYGESSNSCIYLLNGCFHGMPQKFSSLLPTIEGITTHLVYQLPHIQTRALKPLKSNQQPEESWLSRWIDETFASRSRESSKMLSKQCDHGTSTVSFVAVNGDGSLERSCNNLQSRASNVTASKHSPHKNIMASFLLWHEMILGSSNVTMGKENPRLWAESIESGGLSLGGGNAGYEINGSNSQNNEAHSSGNATIASEVRGRARQIWIRSFCKNLRDVLEENQVGEHQDSDQESESALDNAYNKIGHRRKARFAATGVGRGRQQPSNADLLVVNGLLVMESIGNVAARAARERIISKGHVQPYSDGDNLHRTHTRAVSVVQECLMESQTALGDLTLPPLYGLAAYYAWEMGLTAGQRTRQVNKSQLDPGAKLMARLTLYDWTQDLTLAMES